MSVLGDRALGVGSMSESRPVRTIHLVGDGCPCVVVGKEYRPCEGHRLRLERYKQGEAA